MHLKVLWNSACLNEGVIYEVKKGIKESLITQTYQIVPPWDTFCWLDNFVDFLN